MLRQKAQKLGTWSIVSELFGADTRVSEHQLEKRFAMPSPLLAFMDVKVQDTKGPDLFHLSVPVLEQIASACLEKANHQVVMCPYVDFVVAHTEELAGSCNCGGKLLSP